MISNANSNEKEIIVSSINKKIIPSYKFKEVNSFIWSYFKDKSWLLDEVISITILRSILLRLDNRSYN